MIDKRCREPLGTSDDGWTDTDSPSLVTRRAAAAIERSTAGYRGLTIDRLHYVRTNGIEPGRAGREAHHDWIILQRGSTCSTPVTDRLRADRGMHATSRVTPLITNPDLANSCSDNG